MTTIHCPLCGLIAVQVRLGRFRCTPCDKQFEVRVLTERQLDIERFWETTGQPQRVHS